MKETGGSGRSLLGGRQAPGGVGVVGPLDPISGSFANMPKADLKALHPPHEHVLLPEDSDSDESATTPLLSLDSGSGHEEGSLKEGSVAGETEQESEVAIAVREASALTMDMDCEDGAWRMPSRAERVKRAAEAKAMKRKALWVSILTMLFSIPALVGAWCWPALVMSLLGETASTFALYMGHLLAFAMISVVLIIVIGFTAWSSKKRNGTHWEVYGPLYFVLAAAPLIIMDQGTKFLNDMVELPKWSGMDTFCLVCTYVGFVLLSIGTMWNAQICDKIRDIQLLWKELRAGD